MSNLFSTRTLALLGVFSVAGLAIVATGQSRSGLERPIPAPQVAFDEDPRTIAEPLRVKRAASQVAPTAMLPQVFVHVRNAGDVEAIARDLKLEIASQTGQSGVLVAGSLADAARIARALRSDPRVVLAHQDQQSRAVRMAWTPNDPFYVPIPGFPGGQWYLDNTAGMPHINVQPAWNLGYLGQGVIGAVVDDGTQARHPDLAPNFRMTQSYNWGTGTTDPSPAPGSFDAHGTATGGLMAARGGNAFGITGTAPRGGLAGLRIDFFSATSADFAAATLHRSSGAVREIAVKSHSYGYNLPYISIPAEVAAIETSAAAGTLHAVSAGNARGFEVEDSNLQHVASSTSAFCVSALASDGKFSLYSSFGANVDVTVPSSGGLTGRFLDVLSTDVTTEAEGYNGVDPFPNASFTSQFGGTSASAPILGGVFMLAKQAYPGLNRRIARHLLARTSVQVDPLDFTYSSDGGWKTNAAGFKTNQNYGFGLLDAAAFVRAAAARPKVTPLIRAAPAVPTAVSAAIPDNSVLGITRAFNVARVGKLEDVELELDITHTWQGDLEVTLVSPSGTRGRMLAFTGYSGSDVKWKFRSNAFWGERSNGTWRVIVRDLARIDVGTWNSFRLILNIGDLIP